MSARFALKAATDDLHRQLDERLSRLDLKQSADYLRFLDLHARVVPPIEDSLDVGGLDEVVQGWSSARRSPALASDVAALGRPMPSPVEFPDLQDVPALLGTAYVLEGSRLGARVVVKRVRDDCPATFLGGQGDARIWRDVIAALDQSLYSRSLIGEATAAARRCFALFLSVAHEAGI